MTAMMKNSQATEGRQLFAYDDADWKILRTMVVLGGPLDSTKFGAPEQWKGVAN